MASQNDEGWLVLVASEDFECSPLWPHIEHVQKITGENFLGHKVVK